MLVEKSNSIDDLLAPFRTNREDYWNVYSKFCWYVTFYTTLTYLARGHMRYFRIPTHNEAARNTARQTLLQTCPVYVLCICVLCICTRFTCTDFMCEVRLL